MGFDSIELLAPVGSMDSLSAALDNGCDAVYFGLGKFNARSAKANLALDDLAELMNKVRLQDKRAYLTLNTLLYDHELDEALELARLAWREGVIKDHQFCAVQPYRIPDFLCLTATDKELWIGSASPPFNQRHTFGTG